MSGARCPRPAERRGALSVTLLRHGEARGGARLRGRCDDPLSARGWAQLRRAVAGRRWARIVSSPRRRCLAFARWLGRRRGLPVAVDGRWAELDFGAWDGHPLAELWAREGAALARFLADPWAHPPPGGETMAALEARVLAALDALRRGPPGPVLVLTHGGVLRLLLARQRGVSPAALAVPPAACHRLTLPRHGPWPP